MVSTEFLSVPRLSYVFREDCPEGGYREDSSLVTVSSPVSIDLGYIFCLFITQLIGNNASAAARNICAALGEGAVADRTCRDWFKRFREGDMSLEDRPRSGRP
ncbi:unnamed protein product, partial [Rotaria sp. Silwood1]